MTPRDIYGAGGAKVERGFSPRGFAVMGELFAYSRRVHTAHVDLRGMRGH